MNPFFDQCHQHLIMKNLKSTFRILFCILTFTAAVKQVSAQPDNPTVKAEINQANQKFEQIYVSSGGSGIAVLYAKDAIVMPPNADMITTSDGIGKFWKGAFDSGIKKFSLEALTVQSVGDGAVETGKFTLYGADGKQVDTGKYIVFWKKENNEWKLFRDIWNSSPQAK